MKIILARHGNTFGPRDSVVWAGSEEDFPLVEVGREQAELVANAFLELDQKPTHIYSGPLLRTREYAELIAKRIDYHGEIKIDHKLNEINYGLWGGMTSEEIIFSFGQQELDLWNEQSVWSTTFFMESESETINKVRGFVAKLIEKHHANDVILLVSSNGLLRYFLKLIPGEFENRVNINDFKIKTGHLSVIEYQEGHFKLITWNTSPSNLTTI